MILVTGASGMLGSEVVKAAQCRGNEVVAMNHADLDIRDWHQSNSIISSLRPNIVINCAGIVKRQDLPPHIFWAVNSQAPQQLASICDKHSIRLVHISTDCVFDGDGPHYETDVPTASDIYGMTKLDGEIHYRPHLTVRTSFVGNGNRGLLHWLKQQKGDVPGYVNVKWNGFVAPTLARILVTLSLSDHTGLLHIQGEDTTKYDVLRQANDVLGLGLNIIPTEEPKADFRLYSTYPMRHTDTPFEKQLEELRGCDCNGSCGAKCCKQEIS